VDKDTIIRLAEEARIPLNLTDERVTLDKLEHFASLAIWHYKNEQKGWKIKYTDVSQGAKDVEIVHPLKGNATIYSGDKPEQGVRGFLWFWLRPEGELYRQGFNLTILHNGFVLGLLVRDRKYRFRYRKDIKPKFLWSKEQ
jgi:hypothetical protein